MRYLFLGVFVFLGLESHSQQLTRQWDTKLRDQIETYKSCKNQADPTNKCFHQIGQTLHTLYSLRDFYDASQQRYMTISEIAAYVKESSQWTLMGQSWEKEALLQAQELANQKRAVIAIYLSEEGLGQLAFVLPGEMMPSGSWGMPVPNSAAFVAQTPDKSYSGKGLSYAFPRRLIPQVSIYARKP